MKTSIHTATTCMFLAGLLSTAIAEDKVEREPAEAVPGFPFERPAQTRLTELTEISIAEPA